MVLLDLIGTANPTFRNWFEKTEGHFERLKKIGKFSHFCLLAVSDYYQEHIFWIG